jgi:hypothetical protein
VLRMIDETRGAEDREFHVRSVKDCVRERRKRKTKRVRHPTAGSN